MPGAAVVRALLGLLRPRPLMRSGIASHNLQSGPEVSNMLRDGIVTHYLQPMSTADRKFWASRTRGQEKA